MSGSNTTRLAAERLYALRALTRFGIVDRYDPATNRARIVLQPSADGLTPMTGYLPVLTQWLGNGWGAVAPVQKGDQVLVVFAQDHADSGVVVGRLFDNIHPPPIRSDGEPAVAGELLLVHQSGSRLQLTNDQKVLVNGALEIDLSAPTISITASQSVAVTAPAVTISAQGQSVETLLTSAAAQLFNTHTHPGTGAPPSQQMTNADMTATLKAS
jgi:phage baseplate assembly protein gpV